MYINLFLPYKITFNNKVDFRESYKCTVKCTFNYLLVYFNAPIKWDINSAIFRMVAVASKWQSAIVSKCRNFKVSWNLAVRENHNFSSDKNHHYVNYVIKTQPLPPHLFSFQRLVLTKIVQLQGTSNGFDKYEMTSRVTMVF